MKILIVNTHDNYGGAARAALRLHKALLDSNINSQMLVKYKSENDKTIESIYNTPFNKIISFLLIRIEQFLLSRYKKTYTLFSSEWLSNIYVIKKINKSAADIVHLHWFNQSMLSITDLHKINVPIVWSLHDMWAFTGGCHYTNMCNLYLKTCHTCPILQSNKRKDLSYINFLKKKKYFNLINHITLIGLSKWLDNCISKSSLLKDKTHLNLPNPINTKTFKRINKNVARQIWSLPTNKKLILFGAVNATSDPRKGFNKLNRALEKISDSNAEFIVFGASKPISPTQKTDCKINYLGNIYDDKSLMILYNAVDVMIVPSLQENLSNTIMESLACATPVVAFNIGGNSDLIIHKQNGYLAKAFDSDDLAYGIKWILNNTNYNALCLCARQQIKKHFDSHIVAREYIELYKTILHKPTTIN